MHTNWSPYGRNCRVFWCINTRENKQANIFHTEFDRQSRLQTKFHIAVLHWCGIEASYFVKGLKAFQNV